MRDALSLSLSLSHTHTHTQANILVIILMTTNSQYHHYISCAHIKCNTTILVSGTQFIFYSMHTLYSILGQVLGLSFNLNMAISPETWNGAGFGLGYRSPFSNCVLRSRTLYILNPTPTLLASIKNQGTHFPFKKQNWIHDLLFISIFRVI